MKLYTVFTKRLAHELCKKGFELIKTAVNNEKPKFYVYYFEKTPELIAAINLYQQK